MENEHSGRFPPGTRGDVSHQILSPHSTLTNNKTTYSGHPERLRKVGVGKPHPEGATSATNPEELTPKEVECPRPTLLESLVCPGPTLMYGKKDESLPPEGWRQQDGAEVLLHPEGRDRGDGRTNSETREWRNFEILGILEILGKDKEGGSDKEQQEAEAGN